MLLGTYRTMQTLSGFMGVIKDDVVVGTFDDDIHSLGGWNPFRSPVTDKDHFVISSLGTSAVQLADPPWSVDGISNGIAYQDGLDLIVIFNGFSGATFVCQAWKYRPSTITWTVINSDIMADTDHGERHSPQYCYHNGAVYVHGGIENNTLAKSTDNGVTWAYVANSPYHPDFLSIAAMVSFKGDLYIMGGLLNQVTTPTEANRCYRSSDNGLTWELVVTGSPFDTHYCNATATSEAIYFIQGTRGVAGPLKAGLQTSYDGETWTPIFRSPSARHATGMCVLDNEPYMVGGYLYDDVWRVKKIASMTQYFAGKP